MQLDGEALKEITGNRDFSETGRALNVRIGWRLATKLDAEGIIVFASFVPPHRWLREEFKKNCDVVEIHVHTTRITDRETCSARGYEPPASEFVDVDIGLASVKECVRRIIAAFQ